MGELAIFYAGPDGSLELQSATLGDDQYDVDWSKALGEYWYHCSGGGPGPHEATGIYWASPGANIVETECRLVDPEARERNKTRRLTELPEWFAPHKTVREFLERECTEGQGAWCDACGWLPDDQHCEHCYWCDDCNDYIERGEKCEHMAESQGGSP
jgi:hypothetical protein